MSMFVGPVRWVPCDGSRAMGPFTHTCVHPFRAACESVWVCVGVWVRVWVHVWVRVWVHVWVRGCISA